MGQSSYSPPGGGSGGTNFWEVLAGVLMPITIGITSILTKFGNFSMNVTSSLAQFIYNDGSGNTNFTGITASGLGWSGQDAAGNIGSIGGTSTNLSLEATTSAGAQGGATVTATQIELKVDTSAANSKKGSLVLTSNTAYLEAKNGGIGFVPNLGVNGGAIAISTNMALVAPGVMPAVTVGTINVVDTSGTFIGVINLT